MSTIFSMVFSDEIRIPVPNIQLLIDSYHVRQWTGVLRLAYDSEQQLYFLFKRGKLLNTYLVMPEKWEALDRDQGLAWMSSAGSAQAKSVSISSFGLLMTKLLIQSGGGTDVGSVSRTQLSQRLDEIREKADVALLSLVWGNAAGAIFFERDSSPHLHFVAKDVFLDEEGNYKIFCEWDAPQCRLTLFSPDLEVDAWREYLLRSAFAKVCESQLNRFDVLAGRALADSLIRLVTTSASRQGLDISIASRKLEDQEVFSSAQEAAHNYGLLLGEMFKHFSAVVGPRLHVATLREIVKKLPPLEHKVLQDFEVLPQGYFYE